MRVERRGGRETDRERIAGWAKGKGKDGGCGISTLMLMFGVCLWLLGYQRCFFGRVFGWEDWVCYVSADRFISTFLESKVRFTPVIRAMVLRRAAGLICYLDRNER